MKFPDSVGIAGNSATDNGGGVYNGSNSKFTMDGGTITGNDTGNIGFGGGVYNAGTVTLDGGITVKNDQANLGGGLYLRTGSTTNLSAITIQGNMLIGNNPAGKGIYLDKPLTFNPRVNASNSPGIPAQSVGGSFHPAPHGVAWP